MHVRSSRHTKAVVRQAAALSGVEEDVFTMNAAYTAALTVLRAQELTFLEVADQQALMEALDNPPSATDALCDAFARLREQVSSID